MAKKEIPEGTQTDQSYPPWFIRQLMDGIWLKVSNIRLENQKLYLRFEADKSDDEPIWWALDQYAAGTDQLSTYRSILEALDKKRVVVGKLECNQRPQCRFIRIQFTE